MQRVKKKRKGMTLEDSIYHLIAVPIFVILVLICVYPFYYVIISSISDSSAVTRGQVSIFPVGFTLDNFLKLFQTEGLGRAAVVTIARVVLGTFVNTFVAAYAAYFFTKTNMWHRKIWYRMFAAAMYFTPGLIPVYMNWRMLGVVDTFWCYIVPSLFSVYNMVLIKTSIESMPRDLEESAVIDGAGYMQRFFRIVLPLQKAILATVALFSAVGHWNDYFTSRLYINLRSDLVTLQFKLYEIMAQVDAVAKAAVELENYTMSTVTPIGIRMALTAVIIIPIMLVYPSVQKHYVKGVMIGAVKG